MKLYWCSWMQPTKDYRPEIFPPTENILAWWSSGTAYNGEEFAFHTLCAWVQAEDLEDLVKQVNSSWSEIESIEQFRFHDEYEHYSPNDRFPTDPYPWMVERLEKWIK